MFNTITLSIIAISLILILYFFGIFKNPYAYWRSKGVPYEEPTFPYGNTKDFGKTIHPSSFFKNLYDKYKPTGAKICGAYFFHRPWVIILDIELVKNILVKDFKNFSERGEFKRILNSN